MTGLPDVQIDTVIVSVTRVRGPVYEFHAAIIGSDISVQMSAVRGLRTVELEHLWLLLLASGCVWH